MTTLRRILALALLGALPSTGLIASPAGASTARFTTTNGHKVTITLETAADGGYEWAIVQGRNSPKFKVLSKRVVSKNAPGQVGGIAKTIIVLRATERGTATFKAVERRPFDKADVIDSFTLHLRIK